MMKAKMSFSYDVLWTNGAETITVASLQVPTYLSDNEAKKYALTERDRWTVEERVTFDADGREVTDGRDVIGNAVPDMCYMTITHR